MTDIRWAPGVTPVTAQEAIRLLDRDEEPGLADGLAASLELGYMVAGVDQHGRLVLQLTEEGTRDTAALIERLTEDG